MLIRYYSETRKQEQNGYDVSTLSSRISWKASANFDLFMTQGKLAVVNREFVDISHKSINTIFGYFFDGINLEAVHFLILGISPGSHGEVMTHELIKVLGISL